MSESFRPGIEAARVALAGKVDAIVTREHPAGAPGAAISLQEVARRIREGKDDVRLRAWAGQAILKAGSPRDVSDRAQAVLDQLHSQTNYAPDPIGTELIVTAKTTLCLDEHGLCMPIADCDDLVVALGSALMSVGIPVKIIGQSFDSGGSPTHVLLAIETPLGLKKIDPSEKRFRVGEYHPGVREWIIDPMSTGPISLSGAGNFIGIGEVPGVAAAELRIKEALYTLGASALKLQRNVLRMDYIQEHFGVPFDPEPAKPIDSVNDFPTNGIWTARMRAISIDSLIASDNLIKLGNDALKGLRRIAHAPDGDIVIDATTAPGVHGLGAFPIVAVAWAVVAGLTVVGLTVYFTQSSNNNRATIAEDQAITNKVADLVASGKLSTDGADTLLRGAASMRQAQAEANKTLGFQLPEFSNVLKWVAIGAVTVGAVYVLAPTLRTLTQDRYQHWQSRRTT